MTLCTGTPAERSLERYMQGTLPEFEARSFEEHYFDCPVCLAQVEALQAVTAQLANRPVELPKPASKRLFAWPVLAALGSIAAAALVGYLAFRTTHQPPLTATALTVPAAPSATPPPVSIASLADLSLPPFQASQLRGETPDPSFEAGMKSYIKHDCPHAIRSLSHVAPRSDEALAARFYAGVCQVKQGSLEDASATLRKVEAAGDSPQQEAALYYLAQIALVHGDTTAARRSLTHTISLHGDFEARARAQLDKLP